MKATKHAALMRSPAEFAAASIHADERFGLIARTSVQFNPNQFTRRTMKRDDKKQKTEKKELTLEDLKSIRGATHLGGGGGFATPKGKVETDNYIRSEGDD